MRRAVQDRCGERHERNRKLSELKLEIGAETPLRLEKRK